jgi:hypothetical protein
MAANLNQSNKNFEMLVTRQISIALSVSALVVSCHQQPVVSLASFDYRPVMMTTESQMRCGAIFAIYLSDDGTTLSHNEFLRQFQAPPTTNCCVGRAIGDGTRSKRQKVSDDLA